MTMVYYNFISNSDCISVFFVQQIIAPHFPSQTVSSHFRYPSSCVNTSCPPFLSTNNSILNHQCQSDQVKQTPHNSHLHPPLSQSSSLSTLHLWMATGCALWGHSPGDQMSTGCPTGCPCRALRHTTPFPELKSERVEKFPNASVWRKVNN